MNWKNKNVLITGIFGFFAPHISNKLVDLGANVIGSYHDEKKLSYGKMTGMNHDITLCKVDINDLDRVTHVLSNYEIDYIFHCAANSIVKTCVTHPIGAFKTNIIGTANILEASRKVGGVKGVMCMESDKSYGSFESNDLPYKETDQIRPTNVYEVSKACSGLIADAYSHNYNLPVFTIRAANLYGAGDFNTSRVIPGTILRILDGRAPVLYSGVANYVREFLHVDDAADASIALMGNIDTTKSNIYNIGSGSIHTIHDIISIISDKMDFTDEISIIEKDPLFKEIEEQYVDYSKLIDVYPAYNPRKLDLGLDDTIDWYTKNISVLTLPA